MSRPKHRSQALGGREAEPTIDEAALVDGCIRGEAAAQSELFSHYKRHVHAILYRILGSNRDIEDLVQESFLEVFRSLPGFRGNAKLGTWISTISSRVAYGYLRKQTSTPGRLAPENASSDVASGEPSPTDVVSSREAARRLYSVLSKLPPKHRIAYALHVIDGRKLREVATIMESTLVATKSRVWRARSEVRKHALRDPLLSTYLREQQSSPANSSYEEPSS